MKKLGFFLTLLLFFSTVKGQTYTVESVPNPQEAVVPSFVSDPDNFLSAETKLIVNTQIDSLWRVNDTEMAVVVLNSIGFDDENEFANRLYNHWGIGGKTQSNGVLLLLVMDIRRVVIRTGDGATGIIPDIIAKRIINHTIIPEFKKDDYDAGIVKGVDHVIRVVREENFVKEEREPVNWKELFFYGAAIYLLFIVLTVLWIRSTVRKVQENNALSTNLARYTAIGEQNKASYAIASYGLPVLALFILLFTLRFELLALLLPAPVAGLPAYFFGKRKMNKARREPIPCNECGSQMHMLSEEEDDKYLKLSQQFEEKLNSIDYDVFICESCQNESIFSLDKLNTYTHCPRCNTKAYQLSSKKTIVMPTYVSSGTQRSTYHCKFCGFEDHHDKKLPRLHRSASGGVVGGSLSSGRGGFGGGGFGGGGFGGGFSSGGGASGGW